MRAYYQDKHVPASARDALRQMDEQDKMLKLVRGKLTLGDIKDDPRKRRFAVSRVDPSKMAMVNFASPNPRQKFFNLQGTFVDPTNIQQVPGKGSTPSSLNGTFSFTSTTTSITWTWTGLVIYRSDGSTTSISNGSRAFTGLSSGTKYFFYPYYNETTGAVVFAGGALTAASFVQSQVMNAQYNVPLSSGAMTVTTPASGSGGGSGGGGGNGCLHPSQEVFTRRGLLEASDIKVGDHVLTPTGWESVLEAEYEDTSEWVKLAFSDGKEVVVTPSQPLYITENTPIHADRLDRGMEVVAQYGKLKVVGATMAEEESFKVILTIPFPHLFYLYEGGPLIHNGTVKP